MPRPRRNHNNRRSQNKYDEKKAAESNSAAGAEAVKQDCYATIVKENAMFEKYYRQLGLMPDAEFEQFLEILKKPLPITFRITSYKSFSKQLLRILKEKHLKYIDEAIRGEDAHKIVEASQKKGASLLISNSTAAAAASQEERDDDVYKCLSWYPHEMAWHVNLSRQDVRKNVHFEEFKQFLIHQTQYGNISRQEAVSMIPPLVLDVQPHHKILDMCASPGSKTAQLIEFLHQDPTNPTPDGYVIANELDNKRCYMLMHQLKRLESPNFMIVNHDASSMPNMRADDSASGANVLYDRILADVPCSGDGTFRKNVDVWLKWNFAHACNLHGIQSRIATRAAELLQHDGMMVYSTCSLNPVENEAVVAQLLLKFRGQLELVDARHKLPGLRTTCGLLTWNLMSKQGDVFNTVQEVKPEYVCLMRPYMFPPELSVARELGLEKCMRILPHHQNTGGFFVAVIRKVPRPPVLEPHLDANYLSNSSSAAQVAADAVAVADNEATHKQQPTESKQPHVMKAPAAKRLKHSFEENPFQFVETSDQLKADWPKIKDFFQINDAFPMSQMMTRNKRGENVRNIYFVSEGIKNLTLNNADRIKFINMGVPLFSKAEIKGSTNVELRICQESLDIVQKYFNHRIVHVEKYTDLVKILSESMPSLNELSEQLQQQIKEKCEGQAGSFILTTKADSPSDELYTVLSKERADDANISFTAWLGKTTLRPLINIQARNFFLSICGVSQSLIDEACNKIKLEDQMNSEKSLKTNPQFQKKIKEDMDLSNSKDNTDTNKDNNMESEKLTPQSDIADVE